MSETPIADEIRANLNRPTPGWYDSVIARVAELERRAEAHAALLKDALPFFVEMGERTQGYGVGFHPDNPHDFTPDTEGNTPAEIENHRLACEAFDRGEPIDESRRWGIGSYWHVPWPAAAPVLARIRAAIGGTP